MVLQFLFYVFVYRSQTNLKNAEHPFYKFCAIYVCHQWRQNALILLAFINHLITNFLKLSFYQVKHLTLWNISCIPKDLTCDLIKIKDHLEFRRSRLNDSCYYCILTLTTSIPIFGLTLVWMCSRLSSYLCLSSASL